MRARLLGIQAELATSQSRMVAAEEAEAAARRQGALDQEASRGQSRTHNHSLSWRADGMMRMLTRASVCVLLQAHAQQTEARWQSEVERARTEARAEAAREARKAEGAAQASKPSPPEP